jgi:hypothetical protein
MTSKPIVTLVIEMSAPSRSDLEIIKNKYFYTIKLTDNEFFIFHDLVTRNKPYKGTCIINPDSVFLYGVFQVSYMGNCGIDNFCLKDIDISINFFTTLIEDVYNNNLNSDLLSKLSLIQTSLKYYRDLLKR